jgi:uncharacterized membrane protein
MVTTYTVLKTIHVLASVVWVGGGMVLVGLALRARRAREGARLATIVKELTFVGPRVFAPAGLILVGTGIWMAADGDLPYDLWVILGLVGWGATFVTGNFFLGPQSKKLDEALDARGPDDPEAAALMSRILTVARVDILILTLVVADMVIKPD